MHAYMVTHIHMLHVPMHACMHACIRACVPRYIRAYLCTNISENTPKYVLTCVPTHVRIYMREKVYTCTVRYIPPKLGQQSRGCGGLLFVVLRTTQKPYVLMSDCLPKTGSMKCTSSDNGFLQSFFSSRPQIQIST